MIGQLLDERYRIDAPIARGGMSMVFRGMDTRLDRPVAIKVMDPKFAGDPQFLTRFEFEARAVAKLKHPSLVAVYDQGIDGEHPFLIMELVEGGTLRELLRERGPMPPHAVRAVAEPVLEAIGVAHHAGLVHRDIKPENVLVSDAGDVKIADFGLVRAVAASNMTSASVILGTAAYLAPEQVTDGKSDARSDVYSFGILIFELLTGRTPFTGDTSLSIAYQRVEKDVPSPSRFIAGVPPEFDALVARATAREPAHRFTDAAEMAAELRRISTELRLPGYRVPAPRESAEHQSARYRIQPVPQPVHTDVTTRMPPVEAGGRNTRVLTAAQPQTRAAHYPDDRYGGGNGYAAPPPHKPYVAERVRSRRRVLIWSAVVVVLALVLGGGGWWLGVERYAAVPPIAGLNADRATGTLQNAGFATTVRNKASDVIPVGGVVGTDPPAGTRVVKGSTVAVLVSSGQPKVPDFQVGQDTKSVNQAIRDAGLVPVDGGERPSTAAKGTVTELDPAPGTVLPSGATVNIYRSKGSTPAKVPDLRGKSQDEATRALSDVGLSVRGIQSQFDRNFDAGDVVGSDPDSGTSLLSGDSVTLFVSNAVKVPDVGGRSVTTARAMLEAAGLQVNVSQIFSNDRGTVRIQSPGAGARVEPGSTVSLTVLPF
ncbi:Stk1 family PASTA domain-containing Ser/Thr kinase [Nocardia sp. alder85J]|uniref:Stk1 family PASTA domain-containing Ser/Thr kinase n=1 Tax=Nocardia sp. alder85J TaxID=2862949 RepID=UPI001CD25CBB|nr:Stk1 family PASTA domain-containing Ser/Thr kinase [Nocardia sp. alder85J]MCX4098744.1 Stk1 family PASTA domain-containing Ser/Thr kinase [Nocardia sp. alder85J]